MIITRKWAMPNKATHKVYPIKHLLSKYVPKGGMGWFDPFAGDNKICEFRNDIDPKKKTGQPMEAMDYINYLAGLGGGFKGAIIDPPFSLNQMKTLYKEFSKSRGLFCVKPASMIYWSKFKNKVADMIEPGGICISMAWNSMGLGKNRGFEIVEILLVPHGGSRNDTIVTVERKIKR